MAWVALCVLLLAPAGDSLWWQRADLRPTPAAEAPPAHRTELTTAPATAPDEPRPDVHRADLWFGRLGAIEQLLGAGKWSAAAAEFDALTLPPEPTVRTEVANLAASLDRGLLALQTELVAEVRAGAAPRAARRLDLASAPVPHPRLRAALDGLRRVRRWPPLLDVPALAGVLPEPEPLPENLPVLAWLGQLEVPANVRVCSGSEVTLAVSSADGVLFPAVPRAEVMPREPRWALAQCAAAARGDNLALAALWLAVHVESGRPLDSASVEVFAPWLR